VVWAAVLGAELAAALAAGWLAGFGLDMNFILAWKEVYFNN
jgi:hypothetical protein